MLDYDGSHIPTATDEFNAAFSSNVLEHVRDLSGLLGEIKRVVRPGDDLELLCDLEAVRGPVGRGRVRATVGGELAVRGTLTFVVER